MGGKALSVPTERKKTDEYLKIFDEVDTKFREFDIETHRVLAYHSKPDHGDLDILIRVDENYQNHCKPLKEFVGLNFSPKEIVKNGSIVSFDYDDFQIDLIPTTTGIWETSKTFFDYDPTGNLMGKIAHRFGLKYGFSGLVYPFRNFNGRLSENITISKDNAKIFEFLGFDYNEYLCGFENLEEIFKYITNSKYFNSSIFYFENLRHIDKKRNRKRKTYNQFLEYVNERKYVDYIFKNKTEYVEEVDAFFPEAKLDERLGALKRINLENQKISKKFNGHIVMKLFPELKGKELGGFITRFREQKKDFRKWVLNGSEDEIKCEIFKFGNNESKI